LWENRISRRGKRKPGRVLKLGEEKKTELVGFLNPRIGMSGYFEKRLITAQHWYKGIWEKNSGRV
jgi:hypothetical protein